MRCSIWNGYDLHLRSGVGMLKQAIDDNRARHVRSSPPCGPDSNIQVTNQRTPEQIERLRKKRLWASRIQQRVEEVYNDCKNTTFPLLSMGRAATKLRNVEETIPTTCPLYILYL